MLLTHGLMNAVCTVPCFFVAIRIESNQNLHPTLQPIVLFDGLCALCSATVTFLIRVDKNKVLKYSSLQGKYVQSLDLHQKSQESVIFYAEGVLYQKAEAVIRILIQLGGVYQIMGYVLSAFPIFILNKLYDLIAQNRHRILRKKDSCLMLTDENKSLFIP